MGARAESLDPAGREYGRLAKSLRGRTAAGAAQGIVDHVRQELDAAYAGLTLIRPGNLLETAAATHPIVEQVDRLQYELDEGPCRNGSWRRQTLLSSNLAAERRWPRWAARVSSLGITSVLAVKLTTGDDQPIGAINLYWTSPRAFTADNVVFANLMARDAALAVSRSTEPSQRSVPAPS